MTPMMNDATFTSCALVLLAKVDELCEGGPQEPGWYADNPGVLTVTRTADGYSARVEDFDQCGCCPTAYVVHTGLYANERAALTRLGIKIQEQLDLFRRNRAAA